MRENLESGFGEAGEKAGQKVTNAFKRAVATVLTERGIEIDKRPASVELVPSLAKTADLSFRVRGIPWVIEVKSGLEFNSLGAAVLEGVLFRHRRPGGQFVLLSLYSKMKATPDQLEALLMELGVGHAFDHIAVFSLNSVTDDWWRDTARRINEFFGLVPMPDGFVA
ncbi:MAG: hypothetical protein C0467_24650 [Planctomycetaceae bacterium]|nr:hypothetical protein [Planctomycetaceae bacterium]